jgi:ketosteroid isomerase-like protein
MGAISDRARRLNAAVNAHDLNPIGDFYADDAEFIWPGLPALRGRQAVVAFYAELLGAFPDVKVTIKRIVEQGDTVAVEYESKGINGGPLPLPGGQRLPATNRELTVQAVSIGQVDGAGRIQAQREYFDQLAVLQQLGLVPAEQSATGAEA